MYLHQVPDLHQCFFNFFVGVSDGVSTLQFHPPLFLIPSLPVADVDYWRFTDFMCYLLGPVFIYYQTNKLVHEFDEAPHMITAVPAAGSSSLHDLPTK
jgi:hypothetical protein